MISRWNRDAMQVNSIPWYSCSDNPLGNLPFGGSNCRHNSLLLVFQSAVLQSPTSQGPRRNSPGAVHRTMLMYPAHAKADDPPSNLNRANEMIAQIRGLALGKEPSRHSLYGLVYALTSREVSLVRKIYHFAKRRHATGKPTHTMICLRCHPGSRVCKLRIVNFYTMCSRVFIT